MAGEIRLSPAYLSSLESMLRQLPLDTSVMLLEDFSESGPVDAAYEGLQNKWTKHHGELCESLEGLAEVIKAIRESFESTDASQAEKVGG
jgi:hypothetical protein